MGLVDFGARDDEHLGPQEEDVGIVYLLLHIDQSAGEIFCGDEASADETVAGLFDAPLHQVAVAASGDRGLVDFDGNVLAACGPEEGVQVFGHRIIEAARGTETSEEIRKGVGCAGRMTCGGGEVSVFDHKDSPRFQDVEHLAEAGCGVGKMEKKKSAVGEVEGVSGEAGLAGAGLVEADIVEAFGGANVAGFLELGRADVDAGYRAGWADHFGEQAGRHADAAAEVGYRHSLFQSGLKEDSATCGGVDIMQSSEPANSGGPGCERIGRFAGRRSSMHVGTSFGYREVYPSSGLHGRKKLSFLVARSKSLPTLS